MVTIESLTKIGLYSWRLKYSSDLETPLFYIYLDGVIIAETPQNQYDIAINMDESSVIEVLDDPNIQPMQIFPGKVRLGWFFVEGTDYYRIDEYIDSAWVERYKMPENNGYMLWKSRFLEDGQTHIFRIIPVGTNGNEGTAKQFAVLMCRRPDVPDVEYNYNEGAGSIIITDKDSPPSDLMLHCVAHYKMNDNAADTVVLNNMGTPHGTLMGGKTTAQAHIAGKIGGGFDLDGQNDRIDPLNTYQSTFRDSFLINIWFKPDMILQGLLGIFDQSGGYYLFCELDNDDIKNDIDFQYWNQDLNTSGTEGDDYTIGEWTMLTLVAEKLSSSTMKLKIFVDSVLIKESGILSCVMSDFICVVNPYIGARNVAGNADCFDGSLDDFMLFSLVGIQSSVQDIVDFLWNNGDGREDF